MTFVGYLGLGASRKYLVGNWINLPELAYLYAGLAKKGTCFMTFVNPFELQGEDFRVQKNRRIVDIEFLDRHIDTPLYFARFLAQMPWLHDGTDLVARRDIKPQHIASYLPVFGEYKFIRGTTGNIVDAKVLLQGEDIENFYGKTPELRVAKHPSEQIRRNFFNVASLIDKAKKCVIMRVETETMTGEKIVEIEALSVPMADRQGELTGMIVAFHFDSRPAV
jgi:hypothetical protein